MLRFTCSSRSSEPEDAVLVSKVRDDSVPEPTAKIIEGQGLRVLVMKPGDSCTFHGGSIVAVPAFHPGGRNSLKARADGRALGFIIRTPTQTLYYSGDTEYFPGLYDIGTIYHPDIAILNFNGHLKAADALRAFQALGASRVIPIHFGAYGGPTAKRNRRMRAQLLEMLGVHRRSAGSWR